MADNNVIFFPERASKQGRAFKKIINAKTADKAGVKSRHRRAIQKEMFSFWQDSQEKFLFLNPDDIDQESFRSILAKSGVAGIIDFRAKPIFDAPRYRHRELVELFAFRKVRYVDVAFFMRAAKTHHSIFTTSELRALFENFFESGLSFVLIGDELVRGVSVAHIRNFISDNFKEAIEVNPSIVMRG